MFDSTIVLYACGLIWSSDGEVELGEDTSCIAMSTDSLLINSKITKATFNITNCIWLHYLYYLCPTMCLGYSRPLANYFLTLSNKETSITPKVISVKNTLIKDKISYILQRIIYVYNTDSHRVIAIMRNICMCIFKSPVIANCGCCNIIPVVVVNTTTAGFCLAANGKT